MQLFDLFLLPKFTVYLSSWKIGHIYYQSEMLLLIHTPTSLTSLTTGHVTAFIYKWFTYVLLFIHALMPMLI